jgi:hypothetical protein
MTAFLSTLGVAALMTALIVTLIRSRNSEAPTAVEPIAYAPRISGDSRLPSDAFFG